MASVRFQSRGRQGRMPLSYYAPLMVTNGQPLNKVLPKNAVPIGKGNKAQQIGYWNEQPRWRMQKGSRKELPSKWHFYYLGTGPHAEEDFRSRIEGVYWVAVAGSDTKDTGLGTRKSNAKPLIPEFKVNLPDTIEIVEPTTPTGSRSNSRSQSRGRSNNSSPDRGNSNKQNKSRNNSQSRNNNNNKGNQQRGRSGKIDQDELAAAVRKALLGFGFSADNAPQSGKSSKNSSGKNTPKADRSKSPARPSQSPKRQTERPEWKRVPDGDNTVTACFGPRDAARNFGGKAFLEKGILAPGYPQVAQLTPTPAALLFGGNVAVTELESEYRITYTYTMSVPKEDKSLEVFLANVDAYKKPDGGATPKKSKNQKKKATDTTDAAAASSGLNPEAPDFQPDDPDMSKLAAYLGEGVKIQMINEVYDEEEA